MACLVFLSRTYHLEQRLGSALENEIDQLRGVLWSERDPQGRVFVSLADAYRRMGDLPLARSMIEEGLERLPDFASAHVVAGWIHQDLVSPVEAEEAFRRVLDLDPENTIALEAMGGLAGARGSHAEAAEYLRRLSALDPGAGDGDDANVETAGDGAKPTLS
ncbi:MAG: tetratricopeptide repeat protein [Longimicrobiales bacterium]